METRDKKLLLLKGEPLGNISVESSSEELFQNMTIRPILKLQNDLFIQVFINYAIKQKNVFFTLSVEKKITYIENTLQKDIKFRNSLKGMVIGLFTLDDYTEYTKNSSNLNKRMINLIIERLKNNIQLLII
ncbi:glyoxalase [Flavobacterium columnare]|uniref:glyoxalase n=1 Tax=Flavobacterium columnare TaxID=996 RepID=UPI0007F9AC6F|nr:glyoxalase [Flavobacterium columnare]ANO48944.1 hypothetical protein Pf1_00696 [Flavobacterium columnare]APT23045.1 glyoxalase [Flavobacterium columnare]MBF6652631.1 glyoxalase [Flavobacterium columnare]MBF6655281.1 glyoxalase [Flavobacterium columnare]MBF6657869.1 glyoxalase [Flavobacterium columnare]